MEAAVPPFASRVPAPPLRPWVDAYVGYRLAPSPSPVHRGLPSRHLTMIVAIGEPVRVLAQTRAEQPPDAYGFVLSGLQRRPALIAADHVQEGVAIALTAPGSRALLGVPAGALWDTAVEAEAVLGPLAAELRERVHEAPTWPARFAACDAVLRRALVEPDLPRPLLAAWGQLVASGGTIPVAALADAVGWTRRHLAERFGREFGLAPKTAARIVRLERARALLTAPARPSLAEVAAVCVFADQPHLNREFRALAGCTPAQWLAEELPFVQDGGSAPPA
jgi:AraC-like DNA-binding protein